MRGFTLFLSVLLLTLIATEVSAKEHSPDREPAKSALHTCRIVTGYGTAIGKGSTKLAAKEAAREMCGTKLIDDYFARRGRIEDDVVDDLALACVNLECQ